MTAPITLRRLLAGIEPAPQYFDCGPQTTITALEVDSRRVEPGAAFLAVAGLTHDGHAFVDTARQRGASISIVQDDRVGPLPGATVRLADTARAMPLLAANAHGRPADALRLAGVTGTNGKTTTAHLLGTSLAGSGRLYARLGTTGNWLVDHEAGAALTTPFPLELQALLADARSRGATDAVMEVSSHALVQGRAQPLQFHAVGLTSFSQDHLDFHTDMDDYLAAKCRLASEHVRDDGLAVAAVDPAPEAARRFLDAATCSRRWRVSRGDDPTAEIRAEAITSTPSGMRATVHTPMGSVTLHSPLVGGFNLDNLMISLGLGLGLGLDLDAMANALRTTAGAPGRLERVTVAGVPGPTVLVDYAHTPDAVERAIEAVRPSCKGHLVVVLGCGGDRDPGKRPQMGRVASTGADRFWATSDNPRTEDPETIVDMMLAGVPSDRMGRTDRRTDRGRAIADAIARAHDDDVVLIAGKGHEDYQVLGTQTIHFDDREHARAALERRPGQPDPAAKS
ncbi:MAG: UDP-N-acetylmuramoyl-L-alanyl-D-glutamate--2,6-diaminopimelate ligase [Deltaproteobacteria bacterium]|nr:UDP-N-acetylmuramoyl-L-alanyl-D-glutamate--2,6-diaminopimelate ligase [Deltaproteobacteria bacterium]